MSLTNPLGDLPITDPQVMRALAHPVRLALLERLAADGPATATMLSAHVGATPSVTSWHLRHLAGVGLVVDADPDEVPGDRRQRWWKSTTRGFRFEADGPESRLLEDQMETVARHQIDTWHATAGSGLEPEWRRLAGLSNTSVRLTPGELAGLADQFDELLAPYVHRAEPPPDARTVRILRHYLPAPS